MRVLLLHNRYQVQGGEDVVVSQEAALLRSRGIDVDLLEMDNDSITGLREKVETTLHLAYSARMRELVRKRIAAFRADVIHVHNFFPRLTPAVYDAAIPGNGTGPRCAVVQTLHNYRLMCSGGLLFREGKICTECIDQGSPLPGIAHRCYRGSLVGTAALSGMVTFHHLRGTWRTRVDRFITLTAFAKSLFVEHAGLPEEKIIVKANVVPDIGVQPGDKPYALFVGRLSPEKGIAAILNAARGGRFPLPLYIVGSGPLEDEVRAAVVPGRIEFLGKKPSAEVHGLLKGAKMLLAPSMWHEAGVPLVIGEAYSAGVPVITCRVQPMESVIVHEQNGLLIPLGNETQMGDAIRDAALRLHADPALAERLGREARRTYERLYQPEANFRALTAIYRDAMQAAGHANADTAPATAK